MLVHVLDGIRAEAIGTKYEHTYANGSAISEGIWQARSRAYIHLYLKVMFGIIDFSEREVYVTDGSGDGGIDGYFIDADSHTIILIQSKFRHTEENFEKKPIEIAEILSMQIKRIIEGENVDETGVKYNRKIAGLQRRISCVSDLGRYTYRVVIIANLARVSDSALLRLTDGFPAEVIDFHRSYKELLYPVLSGTLFKASGLNITLDLSNKSAGAKIRYSVSADDYECDITVVFVPTIEIAKIMSRYRNSILRYNPRGYLEFEGQKVNDAIRETIVSADGNEFALLNNGITIVCDESRINEQSGIKYRAKLFLLNPQIINGGQTAYTLSRIYDALPPESANAVFCGKEVLVKAIALTRSAGVDDELRRIALIERISAATNSQTAVTLADRTSGDPLQMQIQRTLFDRFGLLYERKKGEFNDAIRNGYISENNVVNRNVFFRVYLAANGRLSCSLKRRIATESLGYDMMMDPCLLDRFLVALYAFEHLRGSKSDVSKRRYTEVFPKIYAATVMAQGLSEIDAKAKGRFAAIRVQEKWSSFIAFAAVTDAKYVRKVVDPRTGEQRPELKDSRNSFDAEFQSDVEKFFANIAC